MFEKTFPWKTFEVYVTSCQYLFQARSKFFKHTWLCEFVPPIQANKSCQRKLARLERTSQIYQPFCSLNSSLNTKPSRCYPLLRIRRINRRSCIFFVFALSAHFALKMLYFMNQKCDQKYIWSSLTKHVVATIGRHDNTWSSLRYPKVV